MTDDDLFQSVSISNSASPDPLEGRFHVLFGIYLESFALAVPSSSIFQASRGILSLSLSTNPIFDLR
jgi:hypothetical protein